MRPTLLFPLVVNIEISYDSQQHAKHRVRSRSARCVLLLRVKQGVAKVANLSFEGGELTSRRIFRRRRGSTRRVERRGTAEGIHLRPW